MTVNEFWKEFLKNTGRNPEERCFETFYFGMNEELANGLLELVLSGKKRATSSLLDAYNREGERPPRPGDLSIVANWAGEPFCVIETSCVTVLPFCDMTFELCSREGEDDCLESWREGHIRAFTQEAELEGFAFSENMSVVFEDFRVIYSIAAM